jgi:hypothetical protein
MDHTVNTASNSYSLVACKQPLHNHDCFSGSTVLDLTKHTTLLPPSGCLSRVAYRCVTVPSVYGERISGSGRCSYSAGTHVANSLFFRLSGGSVLNNVLTFIFRNLRADPAGSLTTSSPMVSLRASLKFTLLHSRSYCLRLRSLMPLLNFGSVRRHFSNFSSFTVSS